MKIIKNSVVVVLFLLPFAAQSQQSNWWIFGNNASINFNTNTAGTLPNTVNEGTSAISNSSGQLLFYTDGIKVFKSDGNIMPDATTSTTYTMSGSSTTAQTLIVPKPGSSFYYVFTATAMGAGKVKYSIVDRTTSPGVVTNINLPMPDPSGTALNDCEKMAAIRHCNGVDFWIITHEKGNKVFKAYLISSAGIGNPVISTTANSTHTHYTAIGNMKGAPNGKMIAVSSFEYGVELFNFNPSSGAISLNKIVETNAAAPFNYDYHGVEFSPNSQYLYYTAHQGVIRYNISLPNAAPVDIVPSIYDGVWGALQYAPDGNIYAGKPNATALPKISSPNTGGSFVLNGFALAPGTSSKLGLPDFPIFNTPVCSQASFVFVNEGQMERSVNTLYGPQIITEVCLPEIFIDGSASSNENSYFLEIRLMTNLMTWANTVVYSQWINTSGPVPPSLIDISQYYSGFIPGSDYLVTLSVGPEWSSMSRLLRPKNCPPSACFVFSGNTQQTTANENSPYGPQQVTSVCMPTVKIDGSCTMNETGYHIQIDPFNIGGWSFITPNFYNNWVSTTLDAPNDIDLTYLAGLYGHTFQLNTAYRVALSVGTTPQNWNTMAKFFRVKDCRGSVQFEEITPEEIAAAQAGESAILIFPNPGSGLFNISNVNGTLGQITVCDVVGKTILNQAAAGTSSVQIDLSAYPPGVYFARIQAGDKIVTRRMIKN